MMRTYYSIAQIYKRLLPDGSVLDDAKTLRDKIPSRRGVASHLQDIIDTTRLRPNDLLVIEFFRNSLAGYGSAQPIKTTLASTWLRQKGLSVNIPKYEPIGMFG